MLNLFWRIIINCYFTFLWMLLSSVRITWNCMIYLLLLPAAELSEIDFPILFDTVYCVLLKWNGIVREPENQVSPVAFKCHEAWTYVVCFSYSRQNRNMMEKHRRDKMNAHISNLALLVPTVANSPKKMDKTSILRLTAAFLRLHKCK